LHYAVEQLSSTWGTRTIGATRGTLVGGRKHLTSIKKKYRKDLDFELALILTLTKSLPQVEVLAFQTQVNWSEPHY
jgi:hypothetical protein